MTKPKSVITLQAAQPYRTSTAVPLRWDQSEERAPMVGVAMCGGDATALSRSRHASGASVPGRPRSSARFASSRLTPSVVVIRTYGDIDVTNAAAMTKYALGHVIRGRGLILDLRGVEFFGTEGFSAVHRVAVGCARTDTAWSLVPGAAVSRLLRICDPYGSLPTAETVDAARASLEHQITGHRSSALAAGRRDESTTLRP